MPDNLLTHFALPVASYASLAGATAGLLYALQPLAWQSIALVGWCVGMPVAMVAGQLVFMGGAGVAKAFGGQPSTDQRLINLANQAADAVGVKHPAVFEVPSREPNAFAASGFGNRDTTVAVTTGLREILSDEELGSVLAHEMGHLRHSDVARNMHVAAATAGLGGIYQVGRVLLEGSRRKSRKSSSSSKKEKDEGDSGAGLGLALMAAGAATEATAHLVRLAASRSAEFKADRAAAEAYGAQTMITALRKIEEHAAKRPADLASASAGKAYAHLMISGGPAPKKKPGNFFTKALNALRTHPPVDSRVAALEAAAQAGLVPARRASSSWF